MPIAKRRGVNIHYESAGSGPPVLLIAGQGMTLAAWWRTVAELSRSFRVLTFDNRDIGRSSRTAWPYVVAQMAEDAVSVLDSAGAERAHVYGMSLGGMVAQELALRHPERVLALVLGSTTAGGPEAILDPRPLSFFVRAGAMAPEEAEWAAVPYNYSVRTRREHGERIAEDIARRMEHQTDTLAYMHQVAAASTHNAVGRLGSIKAPTLVVQGEEDIVMPPLNGRLLAQGIPGAQLKTWLDAGHLYTTDEPEADRDIARFLLSHPLRATDGRAAD